jgi:hypothetical protein
MVSRSTRRPALLLSVEKITASSSRPGRVCLCPPVHPDPGGAAHGEPGPPVRAAGAGNGVGLAGSPGRGHRRGPGSLRSGRDGQDGLRELVADVGLGKVGIVLGIEVSRLARNNADWYHLLDLCALTDTLIADADGVYHTADFNDRLVLGLKGTMSEALSGRPDKISDMVPLRPSSSRSLKLHGHRARPRPG